MEEVKRVLLDVDPATASDGEKDAMDFFLNRVLPSMDANLAKRWTHGTSTHMNYFGSTFVFELGFSLNLLSMFSDTGNVLHNAGLVDEHGNLLPKGTVLSEPSKKRRKKTQTKDAAAEIEMDYFQHVEDLEKAMAKPHFASWMRNWDAMLCGGRDKSGNKPVDTAPPAGRVDTMHSSMSKEVGDGSCRRFFQRRGFLMPDLSSQDSSLSGSVNGEDMLTQSPSAIGPSAPPPGILPV